MRQIVDELAPYASFTCLSDQLGPSFPLSIFNNTCACWIVRAAAFPVEITSESCFRCSSKSEMLFFMRGIFPFLRFFRRQKGYLFLSVFSNEGGQSTSLGSLTI